MITIFVKQNKKTGSNSINLAPKKMATIKFQRAGQQAKFIPNAFNHNGYLVSERQVGVGEPTINGGFNADGEGETWEEYKSYKTVLLPYFDVDKMSSEERQIIKQKNYMDINLVIADGLGHTLIKFQTNDRYSVIDMDAEKAKSIENKEAAIEFADEHFGLKLISRIPKSLFLRISAFSKYLSAEQIDDWFDDMDDFNLVGSGRYLKGWYYKQEAIDLLNKEGYKTIIHSKK